MSSGVYTIPVSGLYQINAAILFDNTVTWNGAYYTTLQIIKNNSVETSIDKRPYSGEVYVANQVSDLISFDKGDTLEIKVLQNTASNENLYGGVDSEKRTYLSLYKIK